MESRNSKKSNCYFFLKVVNTFNYNKLINVLHEIINRMKFKIIIEMKFYVYTRTST